MTKTEMEAYKEAVAARLSQLSPLLQSYALGDFSETPEIPEKEDEFTELLVGLTLMVDDIKEMIQEKEDTISRLEQAEKTLRHQWERFLAIISHFPEALYVADPETYEILFVNKVLEETLGSDPLGKLCYQAFQGFDAPCDFCTNAIILNDRKPYTWEYHNPNINRDYLITDQIIEWPDGRDVRFEVAVDITEFKQIEAELHLKNIVFESSIAANSIADIEGVIQHVNPAFLEMWGYESKDQAIGNSVAAFFVNEEDAVPVIESLNETGMWAGELLAKRSDGSDFVSRGFATVVRNDEGTQIGYQSANLDVTVEKEATDKLKQSVAELERTNADLAKFNRMAVGREMRMIELKREINKLSQELGREPPYDLSFLGGPS